MERCYIAIIIAIIALNILITHSQITCEPICKWVTHDRFCPPSCYVECDQLDCEYDCATVKPVCQKPLPCQVKCSKRLFKEVDGSPGDHCKVECPSQPCGKIVQPEPKCTTVCKKPECKVVCTPRECSPEASKYDLQCAMHDLCYPSVRPSDTPHDGLDRRYTDHDIDDLVVYDDELDYDHAYHDDIEIDDNQLIVEKPQRDVSPDKEGPPHSLDGSRNTNASTDQNEQTNEIEIVESCCSCEIQANLERSIASATNLLVKDVNDYPLEHIPDVSHLIAQYTAYGYPSCCLCA